jgi:DUF1009 family protein
MTPEEIKGVVQDVLAEQKLLAPKDLDDAVLKTIAAILTSFGIEEEDRKEIRADFQHLRRFRKSYEQVERVGWTAAIGVVVTGVAGALWLGFKTMLGK